jgi:hypothetical protein
MKLTSEKGRQIREEYSGVKEKQICDERGLIQMGGNRTKIDGSDGTVNVSIKNFTGSSTQVHLTTQNHFIKVLNLDENSSKFIKMFCGNFLMDNNGKDRYHIPEIDGLYIDSFLTFLTENTIKVIDLIVRNGFDLNTIIYKNLKTNIVRDISYNEIINKVNKCEWVIKKGGIHLKNKNKKTYFHFQREGKSNKNNRYNVLWHIHSNLFIED